MARNQIAELKPAYSKGPDGQDRLDPSVEDWLLEKKKFREAMTEAVRDDNRFQVGSDLRSSWFQAQRSDPQLLEIIQKSQKNKDSHPEFRVAEDGVLERQVKIDDLKGKEWVPVVPAGEVAHLLSWKEFCCRQVHAGILGAHRSGQKMMKVLAKICWWETMQQDLEQYADRCLVCIRNRKRPAKQLAVAVKPSWLECWEEVAVDFEGPMHPEDAHGNRFILSYVCCVSHAVMLEPCKALTQTKSEEPLLR